MLFALNVLQLVLYIALLALAGQGVLYLLAGPGRAGNLIYRALTMVTWPFTAAVRRLLPAKANGRAVGLVTMGLLGLSYVVVTIEKIRWCVRVGVDLCR